MNRFHLLHETPDLTVHRFDHPPHEAHCDPEAEVAQRWSIAFVNQGSFDVLLEGKRRTLSTGSVFATQPGLHFRCSHAESFPTDVCTTINFDPVVVAEFEHAWQRMGWARESVTPRLAYVDRRLADAVANADNFAIERWSLATLTALQDDTGHTLTRGYYAVSHRDIDAVVTTCRAIERDPTPRRSVADRARDVFYTGPQLTHAFRRYLSASPHQYVVRRRLIVSAQLLSAGYNVSESCYRSGFENLSHFCRTFQRAFRVRASVWSTLPLREMRRKVQDLEQRPF